MQPNLRQVSGLIKRAVLGVYLLLAQVNVGQAALAGKRFGKRQAVDRTLADQYLPDSSARAFLRGEGILQLFFCDEALRKKDITQPLGRRGGSGFRILCHILIRRPGRLYWL